MRAIVKVLYSNGYDIDKELAFSQWMVGDMTERNALFADEGVALWDNSGYPCYQEFMKAYLLSRWVDYAMCN